MIAIAAASGLFVLSVLAGMVGAGVAFAAVPFLGLFLGDLANQVQPLALLLNGVTAGLSGVGFAMARAVPWRDALRLAVILIPGTVLGAALSGALSASVLWALYFAAVAAVLPRLVRPPRIARADPHPRTAPIVLAALPISVLVGTLGIGPGFLLVPAMTMLGVPIVRAAAINAVAATPASFLALVPHWAEMAIDWTFAAPLLVAGAAGAYGGARLAHGVLPEPFVRWTFVGCLLASAAAKLAQLAE